MDAFSNATGNVIKGDQVAVYQDTYLELTEINSSSNPKMQVNKSHDSNQEPGSLGLGKTELTDKRKLFIVNRPFLFIFEINRHIVALGRIRDPHWCKFCR